LAPPDRNLLGVCARQSYGRTLRLDLFPQRRHARLCRVVRGSRLIELIHRCDAPARHLLQPIGGQARILEVGFRRSFLRFSGRQRCFSLSNLIGDLALLESQSRRAFLDLRGDAFGAVCVIRALLLQLVRLDHSHHLILLHDVAFVDEDLADLTGDLRADNDVVGRDDAGQDQRGRRPLRVVVSADRRGDHEHQEHCAANAFHVGSRCG
jgi:hypothetical protein